MQTDFKRPLSPLAARQLVGVIGLATPAFLWAYANLGGRDLMQPSISAFYYTPVGDLFVGALVAVGFFLLTYRGYAGRPPGLPLGDRAAAVLAGLGATGTALIPTKGTPSEAICRTGAELDRCAGDLALDQGLMTGLVAIPDRLQTILHYGSAVLFIAMMAYFCLALFPIGPRRSGNRRATLRLYQGCGTAIIACLVLLIGIVVAGAVGPEGIAAWAQRVHAIFWLEAIAVACFSAAWLVKGKTLRHPMGLGAEVS